MDFNTISNILLWAVVIVQAVVIFALIRQVGVLLERVAPAGALAMNQKIEVGQDAPELALQSISDGLVTVGGGSKKKSQLIFFVSPDCPVCKSLLPAIRSSAKDEASWVSVLFASDGKQQDHEGFVKRYKLENHPYVVSELLGKTYGVAKLPYAILIDEQGKVASMGIINSREHLDSLFEAKERNVASIQDYMQNNAPAPHFEEVK
jgi:methylamine dehydrogenase accessory protein MauD|tara:strand:- start:13086 stop:13703 length:618 start_codon:yes stop_codon:yes gene_type:complete